MTQEQTQQLFLNYVGKRKKKQKQSLKDRIKALMRRHIGKENAINGYSLFNEVFGVSPSEMSAYESFYFWNVLKKTLASLRKTNECFIINDNGVFYVLKSVEELKRFEIRTDVTIKALHDLKLKASVWVKNQQYDNF